jgi:hypothetical protein
MLKSYSAIRNAESDNSRSNLLNRVLPKESQNTREALGSQWGKFQYKVSRSLKGSEFRVSWKWPKHVHSRGTLSRSREEDIYGLLARNYEYKTGGSTNSKKDVDTETTPAVAFRNRELLAALMKHNWLGLCLLAHLRASGETRMSKLASKTQADPDHAAGVLAELASGGAIRVKEDTLFVCTEEGIDILKNIEGTSGTRLNPEIEQNR